MTPGYCTVRYKRKMPTGSTSSDSFTWRRTKLRPQQRLSTTGNKTVVRDQNNNNNNKKKSPRLFTDQSANADELQPPPAPPRAARSFCPLVADVKISLGHRHFQSAQASLIWSPG